MRDQTNNQKIWSDNHQKILEAIKSLVRQKESSRITDIKQELKRLEKEDVESLKKQAGKRVKPPQRVVTISRQTIHEHLLKARKDGEIVRERNNYYDSDFIAKRQRAEEAYNEIINFSEKSIEARGHGWWRYVLGDEPRPYQWLDSVKDIREDFAKIRSDGRKDRKRAEKEGIALAEAFLGCTEVNVGTSRGEIRLKDSGKLTRVSGFLPFSPKVKESWDAEVYDKAMSIAYMIYKQLDPHSTMTISSDSEIIVRIRLNLWKFMKTLFLKRFRDIFILNSRSGPLEREPIFPEFEKEPGYQEYEKAESELQKAEEKMSFAEWVMEGLKKNINQVSTEDSKTSN